MTTLTEAVLNNKLILLKYYEKNKGLIMNKIIFITGASSGIGQDTAEIFAQNGAKILLAARRVNRLKKLAANM